MGGGRVPPPPRDLNVQSFAEARGPELESLHAIVAGRVNHDYRERRGKRRRTTSYDTRIAWKGRGRKRRKLGSSGGDGGGKEGLGDRKEKLSRRKRRKLEFRDNPESGFVVSADGTRRLRTHLWHAKRFSMVKRWGFFLPLGLHGKGRGSRAVLKWVKSGAVVHDASYCCPVQLEGPKESLLAVMKLVLVPSPSDILEEVSRQIVCGVRHGSALLYQVGAPVSQFIAPVSYMWRPSTEDDIVVENENVSHRCRIQEEGESKTKTCQLWVWIHAAAFNEGFDALRSACLKQKNERVVSVSCLSLEGQLAKFEVMGFKAIQVLQKILHPLSEPYSPSTNSVLGKCTHLKHCSTSQLQKSFVLEHAVRLPCHAVLSLDVHDPRDLHSEPGKPLSDSHSMNLDGGLDKENSNQIDCLDQSTPDIRKEAMMALWMKPEHDATSLADNKMLWISRDKVNPPIKESILCSEKHKRHLNFFKMDRSNVYSSGITKGSEAASCPMLLLKHNNQRKTFAWWSIVLPLSWAKSFWTPLVSSGVQAIGLRERRWIACDNGLPYFPFDFPDCNAYSLSMASDAVASDQASELHPLSAQPVRIPIPPPWDCVRFYVEEANKKEDMQRAKMQLCGRDFIRTSSIEDFKQDNCCSVSLERAGLPSIGYVARTCDAIQMPARGRSCFLRVLLHAFREGVLEEGAVVCAPILGDISHWTSRSEEQEKLHIPQSFVKSYFTERAPGKWELQVPDNPSIQRSYNHRWPIGFVTTGFVHGSLRPVAEALCEATCLAQLRAQQWDDMQDKERSNIFVLVRNLRSSAYRLALATVVLEQQEDDLEFC